MLSKCYKLGAFRTGSSAAWHNGHNGPVEIADTLGFLLGTWDLSRSYTDHRSGTTAAFQGQAAQRMPACPVPGSPPFC